MIALPFLHLYNPSLLTPPPPLLPGNNYLEFSLGQNVDVYVKGQFGVGRIQLVPVALLKRNVPVVSFKALFLL